MNTTAQSSSRGATLAPSVAHLLERVRAEYEEMPGLCLTLPQAQRLWGLDRSSCEVVLGALVHERYLKLVPAGYRRA
jgi:hypothetical protein